MHAAAGMRQGLAVVLVGRALSALLGVVWLGLLVRALGGPQLGTYFGAVSGFEILQLVSSLGVYSYAQRFVPGLWLLAPRRGVAAALWRVVAWRLASLLLAAAALAQAWPLAVALLGWPAGAPPLAVCVAYLLAEGLLRLADTLLDGALQHGARQLLPLARNVARMAWLAWATQHGAAIDAAAVLALEAALAAALLAGAAAVLAVRLCAVPLQRPAAPRAAGRGRQQRLAFALQGWGAQALGLLTGLDMIKLVVSHSVGPAALALFGVATALVEMVGRHTPAMLFHDVLRAVLTQRAGNAPTGPPGTAHDGTPAGDSLFSVRLLLRVNGACLLAFAAWLAVFGPPLLHTLAAASSAAAAAVYVAALLPLLPVHAHRVMTGLVAHVNADNRGVLTAALATLPVPLLVLAAAPVLGAGAAVLGAWLLELTQAVVLKQRSRLRLAQLCGGGRCWALLVLVALLSALAGAACQAAVAGVAGVLAGSLVFAGCQLALLWRWRVLDAPEAQALRRLISARAG